MASLLLVLLLATLAKAAFHDGITGSSMRFDSRWNQHEKQQSRNLQSFTGSTSAKESCEAARRKEEFDMAPGGGASECFCEQSILDERYEGFLDLTNQPIVWELTCIDRRCSYCSPDGSTCDRFSYGALFEEVKVRRGVMIEDAVVQVAYFETNQYVVGRPEAVVYTEYSDPSSPGSHACSMEIDGLRCAVCEYVNCMGSEEKVRDIGDIDIYYGLNVVCSNILINAGDGEMVEAQDFQTCDEQQIAAIGATQGVFEMYDPDYGQCFTSVEGCHRDQINMEQNGYYECDCLDGPDLGISPFLENVVLGCNMAPGISHENEICNTVQRDEIDRTFSSYAQETNTRTIQLESGSTVVLEEFDCLTTKGNGDGCNQCKALIDGTECDSCEMIECSGESEGILAPSINCGNAVDDFGNSNVNLCQPESSKGTPFEAFSMCGFGEHNKVPLIPLPDDLKDAPPPVSLMACGERLKVFSETANNFVDSEVLQCECLQVNQGQSGIDAGTLLECRSTDADCGSVCNADYNEDGKGLCFREEVVEGFLPNGSSTPMTRTTTYTHGSTSTGNSMVGQTLVLSEFGNGSNGCQLLVDGQSCNTCQLKDCGGEIGIRPLVDCSNVDASLKLDTCDAVASYQDGILMRFASGASGASSQDFGFCNPNSVLDFGQSLPKKCGQAQPIVLPTQNDDPNAIEEGILNPNSIFAFVSFVSSTKDLSVTENELFKVQETCDTNEESYSKSPGLWYTLVGNGKGIHASVCREATNFEAKISVFKGTCESMDCVTSTPLESSDLQAACDVHWIAEEGATYFLRVHGTDESQTGTFNLFLETLEAEVTTNCYSNETKEFDKACMSCADARTMRIQQFENDPAEIDCQCIRNPGTGGYHLTCVDLSCLKCNSRQDICGFDTEELEIKLSGDSPFGSYESFYFMDTVDGAQATEIVSLQDNACLEIHDPHQQCMMVKEELMEQEQAEFDNSPFFCECRQTSPNGNHMLICSLYDSFEFCVENGDSTCADQVLFGQSISQYGSVTSEFRNYVVEDKSITIERFSDMCVASINGESCSSCELLQTCVDNRREDDVLDIASTGIDDSVFTDISVDCSNLVEDAVFECGSTDENNLLSVLAGRVAQVKGGNIFSEKKQTIPPDAFPPTMPPVTRPTSQPVDPPSFVYDEENTIIIDAEPEEDEAKDSSAAGLQRMAFVTSTMAFASVFLLL